MNLQVNVQAWLNKEFAKHNIKSNLFLTALQSFRNVIHWGIIKNEEVLVTNVLEKENEKKHKC